MIVLPRFFAYFVQIFLLSCLQRGTLNGQGFDFCLKRGRKKYADGGFSFFLLCLDGLHFLGNDSQRLSIGILLVQKYISRHLKKSLFSTFIS